jgi:hypothetical protein
MLTFGKSRTLAEIKELASKLDWLVDSAKYEAPSCDTDYIKIMFRHAEPIGSTTLTVRGWVLLSMINGRFFGEYTLERMPKVAFSSDETKYDAEAWFLALLNLAYEPTTESLPLVTQ